MLLPLKAFAYVDISLDDKSTTSLKSASLEINSGTDTLESLKISIEGSEDISFTEANSGTVSCSTFTPTIKTASVDIVCNFDEATVVNGVIANIIFTTDSSDYSIKVVEDTLDLGDAEVGTILNIGEVQEELTTTNEETTDDVSLVSANTTKDSSSNTTFFGIDIMEYLPYILLGGSVILLISIIGVLLSRKKENVVVEEVAPTNSPAVESTTQTQEVTKEPTLRDMVNSNNTAPVETSMPSNPMQEPMNPNLDNNQQKDLQDLVATESAQPEIKMEIPTMPPVEETKPEENLMPIQDTMTTPLSAPMSMPVQESVNVAPAMPEVPVETPLEQPATPIDLQQLVNNEIQQIPPEAIQPEAPVNTPIQDDEALPPVPPQM